MECVVTLLLLVATLDVGAQPPAVTPPVREWTVGFVIVDGVHNTELTAPLDILHHSVVHTDPGMRVFTVAPSTDPVTSFEEMRILPHHDFDGAPPIDVLVGPSAENSKDSDLENTHDVVRERGRDAHYVMSLCDSAFVLARAGLLDGPEVTTFPSDRERLAAMLYGKKAADGMARGLVIDWILDSIPHRIVRD